MVDEHRDRRIILRIAFMIWGGVEVCPKMTNIQQTVIGSEPLRPERFRTLFEYAERGRFQPSGHSKLLSLSANVPLAFQCPRSDRDGYD